MTCPAGENSVPTVAALAVRARDGDGDGFACLLEESLPSAFRLAFAMLGSRESAEDAVQEASLKAWRKLDQLREGSPLGPWFLGIVANECRSLRRTPWHLRVLRVPLGQSPATAPGMDREGDLDLRRTMARRLKRDDRLVLILRYYLDLSPEETAAAMGVSVEAVKSRAHRAAGRLRQALAQEDRSE